MVKDIFKQMVLNHLKRGNFLFRKHALIRMQERGVTKDDIISVGHSCHSIEWQDKHQSYLVNGDDSDSLPLSIACIYEDGTIIVTVF
ncbi:MAG: DUF4258 domain-containing protein [Oligoflexia bacterium]|nr:DUF4258 domain-containing protein [Oligoflexia bacterium]